MAMSSKMLVLKAEPKKIRQDWIFIFFKIGKSKQALIQIINIGQTPQNLGFYVPVWYFVIEILGLQGDQPIQS